MNMPLTKYSTCPIFAPNPVLFIQSPCMTLGSLPYMFFAASETPGIYGQAERERATFPDQMLFLQDMV